MFRSQISLIVTDLRGSDHSERHGFIVSNHRIVVASSERHRTVRETLQ